MHERPFRGPTVLLVGNEEPLTLGQRALCDRLLHVAQPGVVTTAAAAAPRAQPLKLVHEEVSGALAMHHFAMWAGTPCRAFEEGSTCGKFVLDEVVYKTGADGGADKERNEERRRQRAEQERLAEEALGDGGMGASEGGGIFAAAADDY